MKKEEFEEAIAQGIISGFWRPMLQIIIGIVLIFALSIGFVIYSNYEENKCIERGECLLPLTADNYVISSSPDTIFTTSCQIIVGNDTDSSYIFDYTAPSYSDAQIRFEMLRPQAELWIKNNAGNSNWTVKRPTCT